MYYTRQTSKRIKVNHDIESRLRHWVSIHAGLHYERWVASLRIRYPEFDAPTYHNFQRQLSSWDETTEKMIDEFKFDGNRLRAEFPELYNEPHSEYDINELHEDKEKEADKKKVNWIFSEIISNPNITKKL